MREGGSVEGGRAEGVGDGGAAILATVRALQWGQHGLTGVLAVVCTARALAGGVPWWQQLVGVVLVLGWYGYGLRLQRRARDGLRPRRAPGWLSGLALLWVALVAVSPQNVWLAFPLWLLVGHLLPLGRAVMLSLAILLIVVIAPLRTTGQLSFAAVIGPAVGAVVALGVSRAQARLVRDATERQQLIASLVLAQHETATLTDELVRTQHEAGVLAERSRLSRDIHDTLAQGFASILLLARTGGAETDPERRDRLLAQIQATAAEGLAEARRVVGALAPSQLDDEGLTPALRRLLDRLDDETGVRAELAVDGEIPPLPTATEVALLRSAQGALANVRVHSHASRVTVSLTGLPQALRLDVVDDGIGFDADGWRNGETVPSGLGGGYGLRATQARLRELGGTLEVESAPGEGTAVSVQVPLRWLR